MTEVKELWPTRTLEETSAIIQAVYRQVLGNAYVMESERLVIAESRLCDGTISVREFVRMVAKSQLYRGLYFEPCAPYRSVELNCLHLLGRAPADQAEVSTHVCRCVNEGYDADIDSYVDSDEYLSVFGENVVPYVRASLSITGQQQVGYNRTTKLGLGVVQASLNAQGSKLVREIVDSSKTRIIPRIYRRGSDTSSEKRFKIVTAAAKFDAPRRRSSTVYVASGDNMTAQIQRINRTGARIVSITEIT